MHPVYNTWAGIRQRCLNPHNKRYADYGGRGITVCDRWRNSFLNFYADVGERPEGCSLDRIDNDKGYEPGNVQWASVVTQNRNTRMTKLAANRLSEAHTLYTSGWSKRRIARHFGVDPKTIREALTRMGQTPSQNLAHA